VGKSEEKTPLGRSRHRWVDNIEMDLTEIELGGMDLIDLALLEKLQIVQPLKNFPAFHGT
jgi:hypothetical protein